MAVNSGDFVQAAGLLNNLVEQANGDLEHLDMSLYISVGKNYDRESGGGAVTLQSKSITKTPTRQQQQQTVYPDPGFDGLSSVGVTVEAIPAEYVIPSGSVTITENGTVDVSGKAQAIVNVPTGGGEPSLQQKSVTVTPTTQQQQQTVTADPGFDALSSVGVTVEAIPPEYVIPSGSVTITENGTVDVSGKAQAIVNVPTGGGGWSDDEIASAEISGDIVLTVTKIANYAFYGNRQLTGISAPDVTNIGQNAFQNAFTTSDDPLIFPEVTTVGANSFNGVYRPLFFPKCTTCGSMSAAGRSGGYLAMPKLTSAIATDMFRTVYATILDLGKTPSIGTRGLYQGNGKTVIILRKTDAITTLASGTTLTLASTCDVYVPAALLSTYESAANWSNYSQIVWHALEGSPYESEDWPLNQ